jgi:bifunctional NMN adenylyltransferase/nudix hydrolase
MNNTNSQNGVGVVVGRFQVPSLHEGHRLLIGTALWNHKRVIVFVGTSPVVLSKNDPFNFAIRAGMISEEFSTVKIVPIRDEFNKTLWSQKLDNLIQTHVGDCSNVILYGSRNSFIDVYNGNYKTKIIPSVGDLSATKIRKELSSIIKNNVDFRDGIIYATQNQYDICYATVDMAVLKKEGNTVKLLLGKKPNSKYWVMPGGFSDVNSNSYEEDASREIFEETCLVVDPTDTQYIGSVLVDDPRYRSQTNKIKTLLFVITKFTGEVRASDDLEEVRWFDLVEITTDIICSYHIVLLNMLTKWLEKHPLDNV